MDTSHTSQTNTTTRNKIAWLFGVNFIWNVGVSYNVQVIAQGRYTETFISDLILGVIAFYMVKRLSKAEKWYEMVAYTIGGAIGAVLGIVIQKGHI